MADLDAARTRARRRARRRRRPDRPAGAAALRARRVDGRGFGAGSSRSRPTSTQVVARDDDRRASTAWTSSRAARAPALPGGSTPIGDALVLVTVEDEPDRRGADRGPPGVDRAGRLQPRRLDAPAPDRASRTRRTPRRQQVSSIGGNVNTNAGGPHCLAYGVTSAHVLARGRRAARREPRAVRLGGPGRARLRPPRLRRRDPRERSASWWRSASGSRRSPPAVRTMLLDFTDGRRLRAHRLRDRRERRRAGGDGDDGPGHRPRRRGLRARGLPDRRGRRPARRGRRAGGRRRRAGARGGGARPREHGVRTIRRRGRRRRTSAALERSQVGVRRGRADRAALPPARLRGAAHAPGADAHGRLRDRPQRTT